MPAAANRPPPGNEQTGVTTGSDLAIKTEEKWPVKIQCRPIFWREVQFRAIVKKFPIMFACLIAGRQWASS